MKKCIICYKEKTLNQFHLRSRNTDKYDGRCRECSSLYHRQRYLDNIDIERPRRTERSRQFRKDNPDANRNSKYKSRYGITMNEKQTLINQQNNKCAICKYKFKNFSEAKIDHNHKTKQIRGILCDSCNLSLGRFKDNPQILLAAVNYLLV